jgi:hypothetical protein
MRRSAKQYKQQHSKKKICHAFDNHISITLIVSSMRERNTLGYRLDNFKS